jgi:hypothetical protein
MRYPSSDSLVRIIGVSDHFIYLVVIREIQDLRQVALVTLHTYYSDHGGSHFNPVQLI